LWIAQLRRNHSHRRWTAYWADGNQRRHRDWDLDPSDYISAVLGEDPTCSFFG